VKRTKRRNNSEKRQKNQRRATCFDRKASQLWHGPILDGTSPARNRLEHMILVE